MSEELDKFQTILREIPNLKAPGASGSRIKHLTEIAVRNVKQESKLIPLLYSACKSFPSSHKLGSMYIVDSIAKAYSEEAKRFNEDVSPQSPEGTFGAGLYKISELLDSLMDDALELSIVKSHTIKILKLLDIWERAETFDNKLIESIRAKHIKSTTPPGTPPPGRVKISDSKTSNGKSEESNSILLALASLAQKSNSNNSTPNPQNATPNQSQSSQNQNTNNILAQLSAISGGSNVASNAQSVQTNPSNQPSSNNNVLDALQQMQNSQMNLNQRNNNFRDEGSYSRRRDRSRSPRRDNYGRRERSPPRYNQPASLPQIPGRNGLPQPPNNFQPQNNFPVQNSMPPQNNFPQQSFQQPNNQYGSPNQQFNSPPVMQMIQQGEQNVPENPHFRPRNMGMDSNIPQGSIKVLSRTLFIGGVPRNMGEHELSDVLRPFAEVQSIILNHERKHAFVKVYSRAEAERAIASFNKDNALPLRTRWGVGFGPRDCCNYQQGISIIPIARLTDADRQWIVQAQWGGTGGQPLVSGIVVDEPDIEVGSGISSKAMSKKMPTNSTRNGPKSNRPGDVDGSYGSYNNNFAPNGGPNYNGMNQANPLQGLFNSGSGGPPPNMTGNPNLPPMPNFGMNGQQSNPNLGNQLSNFFNQQN